MNTHDMATVIHRAIASLGIIIGQFAANATENGNPLTFTARSADSSVTLNCASGSDISCRLSGGDWTAYTTGTEISLSTIGSSVSFRGSGVTTSSSQHFTMTGSIAASGSVTSLTDGEGTDPGVALVASAYDGMFYGCTSLISMPDLIATNIPDKCYRDMFQGCSSLIVNSDAPGKPWLIPANAVTGSNWNLRMFSNTGGNMTAKPNPGTTYYIASAPSYGILVDGMDIGYGPGDGWTFANGVLTLSAEKEYNVSGTNTSGAVRIEVTAGASVTLENLCLVRNAATGDLITFTAGSATLNLVGTNTVYSASEYAALAVSAGAALAVTGSGELVGGKSSISRGRGACVSGTLEWLGGTLRDYYLAGKTGSTLGEGAGICVGSGGTLNLRGGALVGMRGYDGGAIFTRSGTVNVYGGEVSNNEANFGAAIYGRGTVNVYGGTFSDNMLIEGGHGIICAGAGDICVYGGVVTGECGGKPYYRDSGYGYLYGAAGTDLSQTSPVAGKSAVQVAEGVYVVGESVTSEDGELTGGTFTFNPTNAEYVALGLKLAGNREVVKASDTEYSIVEKSKIGVMVGGRDVYWGSGDGWTFADGLLSLTNAQAYTVSGTNKTDGVRIAVTANATVTLENLEVIRNTPDSDVITVSASDAKFVLVGTSTLYVKNVSASDLAYYFGAIKVASGAGLTVSGNGELAGGKSAGYDSVGANVSGTLVWRGGTLRDYKMRTVNVNNQRSAGIDVASGGVFNMYGGRIVGMNGYDGGAIFTYGTVNIWGGDIAGNEAVYGAAIYGRYQVNVYGGNITNNTVTGGGIICAGEDTVRILGGVVSGNVGTMYYHDFGTCYLRGAVGTDLANASPSSGEEKVVVMGRSDFFVIGSGITTNALGELTGGTFTFNPTNAEYVAAGVGLAPYRTVVRYGDTDYRIAVAEQGIKVGGVDVGTGAGDGWTFADGVLTLSAENAYTVSGTNKTDGVRIEVTANATVTLENLEVIRNTPDSDVITVSASDAKFVLVGTSTLYVKNVSASDLTYYFGAIKVASGAGLMVSGDGEFAGDKSAGYDSVGANVSGTLVWRGGTLRDYKMRTVNVNNQRSAGIDVANGGVFNMYGGRIIGMNGYDGGAIFTYGTVNVYGGDIAGNEAVFGVAIYGRGQVNIYGGNITNNVTTGKGIVCAGAGTVQVYGGVVSGNVGTPYYHDSGEGMLYGAAGPDLATANPYSGKEKVAIMGTTNLYVIGSGISTNAFGELTGGTFTFNPTNAEYAALGVGLAYGTLLVKNSDTEYVISMREMNPLTFTAQAAGSSVALNYVSGSNMLYRLNDGNWTAYEKGTAIALAEIGDRVSFVGRGVKTGINEHFAMSGSIAASGSVTSLTDGLGCDTEVSLEKETYAYMFYQCAALVSAPELPATKLSDGCYMGMFQKCTSLTDLPVLNAVNLANNCYQEMFYGCSSLIVSDVSPGKLWLIPANAVTNKNWNARMFKSTGGNVEEPEVGVANYIASAIATAVARIGTNEYATIEAAWGAATDGAVIEFTTESVAAATNALVLGDGMKVTLVGACDEATVLDLGGVTLSLGEESELAFGTNLTVVGTVKLEGDGLIDMRGYAGAEMSVTFDDLDHAHEVGYGATNLNLTACGGRMVQDCWKSVWRPGDCRFDFEQTGFNFGVLHVIDDGEEYDYGITNWDATVTMRDTYVDWSGVTQQVVYCFVYSNEYMATDMIFSPTATNGISHTYAKTEDGGRPEMGFGATPPDSPFALDSDGKMDVNFDSDYHLVHNFDYLNSHTISSMEDEIWDWLHDPDYAPTDEEWQDICDELGIENTGIPEDKDSAQWQEIVGGFLKVGVTAGAIAAAVYFAPELLAKAGASKAGAWIAANLGKLVGRGKAKRNDAKKMDSDARKDEDGNDKPRNDDDKKQKDKEKSDGDKLVDAADKFFAGVTAVDLAKQIVDLIFGTMVYRGTPYLGSEYNTVTQRYHDDTEGAITDKGNEVTWFGVSTLVSGHQNHTGYFYMYSEYDIADVLAGMVFDTGNVARGIESGLNDIGTAWGIMSLFYAGKFSGSAYISMLDVAMSIISGIVKASEDHGCYDLAAGDTMTIPNGSDYVLYAMKFKPDDGEVTRTAPLFTVENGGILEFQECSFNDYKSTAASGVIHVKAGGTLILDDTTCANIANGGAPLIVAEEGSRVWVSGTTSVAGISAAGSALAIGYGSHAGAAAKAVALDGSVVVAGAAVLNGVCGTNAFGGVAESWRRVTSAERAVLVPYADGEVMRWGYSDGKGGRIGDAELRPVFAQGEDAFSVVVEGETAHVMLTIGNAWPGLDYVLYGATGVEMSGAAELGTYHPAAKGEFAIEKDVPAGDDGYRFFKVEVE